MHFGNKSQKKVSFAIVVQNNLELMQSIAKNISHVGNKS